MIMLIRKSLARRAIRASPANHGIAISSITRLVLYQSMFGPQYLLSRDMYEQSGSSKRSIYPKPVKSRIRDDLGYNRIKASDIQRVLDGNEQRIMEPLKTSITSLQQFLATDFEVLTTEAAVILCGLTDCVISKNNTFSNEAVESAKIRKNGEFLYKLTQDTLLVFGDLQYLSTPLYELQDVLEQIGDKENITTFMKNIQLYEKIIPFRGSTRTKIPGIVDPDETRTVIRDATALGSFYTMTGILASKYGKDKTVENFLVPKVFNGKGGIIEIITERIGKSRL